ncbi:MAG: hypothetical protein E7540_01640 [Ruminococcaceae bacterium]|nr:hypothetical protein [Oscillospiraceae bacterium]
MYSDVAINVTFTGIVIVFSMLVLLVLVLMIFGLISSFATKLSEKKSERINKAQLEKMALDTNIEEPIILTQNAPSNQNEIVAAISAAIATIYSGSGKKPIIKSIKKSGSRRSAWASAGIADNTRTF